jgi:polyisoprenoid-binding protein YceI
MEMTETVINHPAPICSGLRSGGVFTLLITLIISHTLPYPEVRENKIFMTRSGHAEFTSRVPLHTFTGESGYLTGMIDPEENLIDFYLDLNTLKTGIDRRDRDMYRTLNVSDHPFAEFTGALDPPLNPVSDQEQRVTAVGDFTLNGVTNEVEIEGTLRNRGEELHLDAEWNLNLNDFDIEPPGILFYRVNEEQEIRIEAVLTKQPRE